MVAAKPTRTNENSDVPPKTILAVLAFGTVARLFVLWMAVAQHGATWLYTRGVEVGYVASSLLSGHGFASPFGGETGPTALIAPGYPIFVAGVFRLLGPYSIASAICILLLQLLVNVGTIAIIMRAVNALAGRRAALFAGLFWASWPPLLWMPTIFWETSLSAMLLIGLLLFAQRLKRSSSPFLWVAFGITCGITALINMALLTTLCGVIVWLGVLAYRTQKRNLFTAVLCFAVVFSVWPIRNARTFHAFIPLRTTVGLELWMGNHDGANGYLEESLFPIYNKAELREYLRVGEIAYDHAKSAEARAWIAAHPANFLKLSVLRVIRFWIGSGSRNGSLIFVLGAVFTSVGGLWGLFLLYRRGAYDIATLITIPLVLFPLPYYITHAEFRYRLVLDPLLTLLSAYAVMTSSSEDSELHAPAPQEAIDQAEMQLVG